MPVAIGFHREYRRGRVLGAWFSIAALMMGAAALVVDIATDDSPVWLAPVVAVGFVAFFAFLIRVLVVSATVADDKQLVLHRATGRVRLPWRSVQHLALESRLVSGGRHIVEGVVYDEGGRRRELPYVNNRALPDADAAIAELTAAWVAGRGPDWERRAELTVRTALPGGPRRPAAVVATSAAVRVFAVGATVFLVLLFSDAYAQVGDPQGFVDVWLGWLAVCVGYPLASLVAVFLGVTLRRRRSGR